MTGSAPQKNQGKGRKQRGEPRHLRVLLAFPGEVQHPPLPLKATPPGPGLGHGGRQVQDKPTLVAHCSDLEKPRGSHKPLTLRFEFPPRGGARSNGLGSGKPGFET